MVITVLPKEAGCILSSLTAALTKEIPACEQGNIMDQVLEFKNTA